MDDPTPPGKPTPTLIWFAIAILVIGAFVLLVRGVGPT